MERNEAIDWCGEGLSRVRDELDCCMRHFEEQEFAKIVTHVTNVDYGVKMIGAVLFEHVLGLRERAEVVKVKTELETGVPMRVEEFKDGFMLFPESVEAPDDLSELDD